jgi:hypothetical protein
MATIYAEDWTPGNSLFTATDTYNRPVHGTDPLYPYIRGAEEVTIRAGRLDYQDFVADYSVAGVWIKGPGPSNGGGAGDYSIAGFWDGDHGCIECTYHPTTASLHPDNNIYCPLIQLASPSGVPNLCGVAADLSGGFLEATHRTEAFPGGLTEQIDGAPMPVAGAEYKVRLGWQCGTYNGSVHAADGFMKVWINDELIYHAADISLHLTKSSVPVNMVDSVQFGYFGLLGPMASFTIADAACADVSPVRFVSGGASTPTPWIRLTLRD